MLSKKVQCASFAEVDKVSTHTTLESCAVERRNVNIVGSELIIPMIVHLFPSDLRRAMGEVKNHSVAHLVFSEQTSRLRNARSVAASRTAQSIAQTVRSARIVRNRDICGQIAALRVDRRVRSVRVPRTRTGLAFHHMSKCLLLGGFGNREKQEEVQPCKMHTELHHYHKGRRHHDAIKALLGATTQIVLHDFTTLHIMRAMLRFSRLRRRLGLVALRIAIHWIWSIDRGWTFAT